MVKQGALYNFRDHSVEVLATPARTRDRYLLRIVAEPGGGPGISGDGPHLHPGLVETFQCVSGEMRALLGKRLQNLIAGDSLEVPPGTVHGFVNAGKTPLVLESEVIFTPPGVRRVADVLQFAAVYDGLVRDGRVSSRTGEPNLLQAAVLFRAFREGIAQPGWQGVLLKMLAPLGTLRGYRSDFPEYVD